MKVYISKEEGRENDIIFSSEEEENKRNVSTICYLFRTTNISRFMDLSER